MLRLPSLPKLKFNDKKVKFVHNLKEPGPSENAVEKIKPIILPRAKIQYEHDKPIHKHST